MDRVISNVGESIYEWMFTKPDQNKMTALAKLAAALFGTGTIVNGLSCVPTGPASMQVVINPGEIYSQANLEASVCGTLPVDSTHQILKQGILLDAFTTASGALAAPGTAGQSINYLIEAQYADSDVSTDPTTGNTPVVLQFYNASNPTQPWSGPNNSGQTSTTFRKGIVSLQVKAGAAATTGSQTTPSPDAGWTGLWVVTVANGQATITAGNISQYAGAPILPTDLLHAVQYGNLSYNVATGTANAHVVALTPKLTQRVDGMVIRYKAPAANTGALTLDDGLGSVAVVGGAHAALQGGETAPNGDAWVQWNSSIGGGSYILLECTGGALQVPAGSYGSTPAQFDATTKLATMAALQRGLGSWSGVLSSSAAPLNLTAANIGQVINHFATAGSTINLPASAGLIAGAAYRIQESNGCTIAANGADTIVPLPGGTAAATLVVPAGMVVDVIYAGAGQWLADVHGSGVASKTVNGYLKLPSGIIWQWGTVAGVAAGGGSNITYPITFPTAVLIVMGTIKNSGGVGTALSAGVGLESASGVTVFNNGNSGAAAINWNAIGY